MWELLSGVNWEFVGVVVTLVGIACATLLGVVVYLLQRRRKELGYRVISHTRLVSVEAEVEEEVVISFRGETVRDVHLVMVEVVNSGNQAIVGDDYERALCVDLGAGARVMSVEQVESEPVGIDVSPVIVESRDKVKARPVLLNPGDSFTLKILASAFAGTACVAGRIVGVKEIKALPSGVSATETWKAAFATAGLALAVATMGTCVVDALVGTVLDRVFFAALTALMFGLLWVLLLGRTLSRWLTR
jgi:hypothetical protein